MKQRGFTLIELMIVIVILTIAVMGLLAALVSMWILNEISRERTIALNAAQEKLEEISASPFNDIYNTYNNGTFDVDFFPGGGNDGSSTEGSITLFVNETDTSEDAQKLGLPMDLNADGDATDTDVSTDYELLPVKISVDWTSTCGGNSNVELYSMISQK